MATTDINQSSKFSFSCVLLVLLVERVSREIDEITLSPSHQRARETRHYSPVNNKNYHSLYSILDFDWLIYLQITACKYRSAANNWCKYFIEHAHFENASSASIKKYLSFKMSTWLVLQSYEKANCPLYWKKRMQKTPKMQLKLL